MQLEITFVGLKEAIAAYAGLQEQLETGIPRLMLTLGTALVEDVKTRIIRRDNGSWAPASKWARAKTGYSFPTLLGAEKYVRLSIRSKGAAVVAQTPKEWTLTQHHEGFENKLYNDGEETDEHGRVTLKIKDAGPLNLYQEFKRKTNQPIATVFKFVPQKPGHTPARKIWPGLSEIEQVAQPVASRWLKQVLSDAGVK